MQLLAESREGKRGAVRRGGERRETSGGSGNGGNGAEERETRGALRGR